MKSMKAAIIYEAGGPERLILREREIPTPEDGQVLVRVRAFGLNRSELMTRKGFSPDVVFPRILGIECVGEVVCDPSGQWSPGQRVAACMGGMGRDFDGSYAEYTVLPKAITCQFTSDLPWHILGAIPEMFQTAYGSLYLALGIRAGESLLVRGATSSVGLLAIQIAKQAGLTVIATTRNPEKDAFLRDRNADYVLVDDGNLQTKIKGIGAADKVLELIGTNTLKDSLACARPGGLVCMTGMLSETWSVKDFAPMDFIPSTVGLTVYDSGQFRLDSGALQLFISDVAAGAIQLPVGRVFGLEGIVEAHRLMDSNSAGGKIVITND